MAQSEKIVIAYIMGPTQAISLDTALYELFPNESRICRVLASPDASTKGHPDLSKMGQRILETSKHKYEFVDTIDQLLSIPKDQVSHFFYAHDCVGNNSQNLARNFHSARWVCLGDALGTVYDRGFHVDHLILKAQRPEIFPWFKMKMQRFSKLLFSRRDIEDNKAFIPDLACLIIPVDQTGLSLIGVPLHVPPKYMVLQHLHRMRKSFPEIETFFQEVQKKALGQKIYFLLIENHFECGSIEFDKEIGMYNAMIEDIAPPGSVIVLKGHPAEQHDRYKPLSAALGSGYTLLEVPSHLRRVPFEIWDDVIPQIEVICSSYPTLSLAYLFDKKIRNPQNPEFIARWFFKQYVESYVDGLMQYLLPVRNLPRWKGKGLLFKGPAHLKKPNHLEF